VLLNYDTLGWETPLPGRPDAPVVPSESLSLCLIDYYLFSYAEFQNRIVLLVVYLTRILFDSHCYLDLVRLLRLIVRWEVISERRGVHHLAWQDLRSFSRLNYVRHLGIPCEVSRRRHAKAIILVWVG
jgi:hypothetical protein